MSHKADDSSDRTYVSPAYLRLRAPIEGLIPGLRGRVLTALVRQRRPSSIRAIARGSRSSSPSSITAVLEQLVDEGLVQIVADGPGGRYFELMREQVVARHLIEIDLAFQEVVSQMSNQIGVWPTEPMAVVVVGPAARYEPAPQVDLLIVWPEEIPAGGLLSLMKMTLGRTVEQLTRVPLVIVEYAGTEWDAAVKAREPLVAEVLKDGISVRGVGPFLLAHGLNRSR